jgi:hypothetical protein
MRHRPPLTAADDIIARMFAVADMVAVVGMSLAIPTTDLRVFVSFYMSVRVLLVIKYVRVWVTLQRRFLVSGFIGGFTLGLASWTGVLCVRGTIAQWIFASAGFACDYGTPFVLLPWMLPVCQHQSAECLVQPCAAPRRAAQRFLYSSPSCALLSL